MARNTEVSELKVTVITRPDPADVLTGSAETEFLSGVIAKLTLFSLIVNYLNLGLKIVLGPYQIPLGTKLK